MAALDTHHSGKRATSSGPIHGVLVGQVLDARHVTGDTFTDENGSIETERVAVLGVKVRGECASTFVTKEIAQRFEFAGVARVLSTVSQLSLKQENEKLLGVNLGHLHITVGISIK